jgi:hypothetical protein
MNAHAGICIAEGRVVAAAPHSTCMGRQNEWKKNYYLKKKNLRSIYFKPLSHRNENSIVTVSKVISVKDSRCDYSSREPKNLAALLL